MSDEKNYDAENLQMLRDEANQVLLDDLVRLVRASPVTQREIERLNGWSDRYLSGVLSGNVRLTTLHMFGILRALDLAPEQVFERLYGERRAVGSEIDEIRQRIAGFDEVFKRLKEQGVLDGVGPDGAQGKKEDG